MSKRKSAEPMTKVTLNVFAKDYERMQALYPQIGATVAIRMLIRQHVGKVEAKTARLVETDLVDEIDLDLEELNV